MSFNRIIAIFGIVLFLFAIIVFYIFSIRQHPQTTNQPLLKTGKVAINKYTFTVEIATNSAQQELGLSKRQSLPQDSGMLFVFSSPGFYPFWMRDMQFPIDIIFIRDNKIVTITKNVPPPTKQETNLPVYLPTSPVNYALEINAGLADKDGFQNGDEVRIEK